MQASKHDVVSGPDQPAASTGRQAPLQLPLGLQVLQYLPLPLTAAPQRLLLSSPLYDLCPTLALSIHCFEAYCHVDTAPQALPPLGPPAHPGPGAGTLLRPPP